MNKEKVWNLIGILFGVLVIAAGIYFTATPADSFSTSSPTSASFGADFYTYEYEATQYAAQNAAVTANNIRELGEKLALYSGTLFIILGMLIILHYGKQLSCTQCTASVTVSPAEYPNETQPFFGSEAFADVGSDPGEADPRTVETEAVPSEDTSTQ